MTKTYKLKILRWLNRQVSGVIHSRIRLTKDKTLDNLSFRDIHISNYEMFKDVVKVIQEYEVGSEPYFTDFEYHTDYKGTIGINYRYVGVYCVVTVEEWEDFYGKDKQD